jgi:hypothetical protein
MTSYPFRVARSILPLGLAGLALVAQVGAAKAEINDGLFGALSRLFAPPPEARYAQPIFAPQVRITRPRRPIRVRHASLPRAVKEKPQVEKTSKVTIRGPNGDAVANALNDSTLRRGDIVVLPGGPKVFRGGATAPYRLNDFDDPRHSKLLGDKTRRDLMAMRLQPGVGRVDAEKEMPAAEGRSDRAENDDAHLTVTVSLPRKVTP